MATNPEGQAEYRSGKPAPRAFRVLIVGLGNPILGDDGAGWRVAAEVQNHLTSLSASVEVEFASVGGLSLMERILGYRHVILVDTMQTGNFPEGSVRVLSLAELPHPDLGHTSSAHDASLTTALQTAESMGAAVPLRVDIVAIESRPSFEFSEELTPKIRSAVPTATRKVLELIALLQA